MILAMDIGNTNIEIGILHSERGNLKIEASTRYFTRVNVTRDEFGIFILSFLNLNKISSESIKSLIYSSVVPQFNNIAESMFRTYFGTEILTINANTKIGITNSYKNPREVGSDRLVNAVAVHKLYDRNAIIVDMGTATTIDVLTKDAKYLGGAIFPGIHTATNALRDKTARLPAISIAKCDKILAEDTASAIEAGVFYSNYYALKGMISKLAEEVGFNDYIKIGTGGITNIFCKSDIFDEIDLLLALKGLKIIYDINKY